MTPIPRSWAATSKEQRVRVLVFSKISAIFLPSKGLSATPFSSYPSNLLPYPAYTGSPPVKSLLMSKNVFPVNSFCITFHTSFDVSTTALARPASPCISDGMMIFVALPSAAFSKASRLFNVNTAFCGSASFR